MEALTHDMSVHESLDLVAAKDAEHIILEGDEEASGSRIALATGHRKLEFDHPRFDHKNIPSTIYRFHSGSISINSIGSLGLLSKVLKYICIYIFLKNR